jgi:tetratricopeptide (TPR) repeat protein
MNIRLTALLLLSVAIAGRNRANEVFSGKGMVEMYDTSAAMVMNKGNDLISQKNYARAEQLYNVAITHDPKAWPPYFNRARAYIGERNWPSALHDLDTTLRLKPSFLLAAILRGAINEHIGNYTASLADFDRVISLHPLPYTCALALNSRAWLRATCPSADLRNGPQAISDATAACNATSWSRPEYIDTLAAAFAEGGDFDSATRFEQRALKDVRGSMRTGYEQRLKLFQAHRPFHYPPH